MKGFSNFTLLEGEVEMWQFRFCRKPVVQSLFHNRIHTSPFRLRLALEPAQQFRIETERRLYFSCSCSHNPLFLQI